MKIKYSSLQLPRWVNDKSKEDTVLCAYVVNNVPSSFPLSTMTYILSLLSSLSWHGHIRKMPNCRLPNYFLELRRSRSTPQKKWRTCVLKDVAKFTGVYNIDIRQQHTQVQAANRVQQRHMFHRQRDVCVLQATPTTLRRPDDPWVTIQKKTQNNFLKLVSDFLLHTARSIKI